MFKTQVSPKPGTWLPLIVGLALVSPTACTDDPSRRNSDDVDARFDQNNPDPRSDAGMQDSGEDASLLPPSDAGSGNDATSADDADVGDDTASSSDAGDLPDVIIPEQGCAEVYATNQTWNADPLGPLTQYSGNLAYDGEALWVTFARPRTETGQTSIYITRLGCDGQQLVPPREVITSGTHQSPLPVMTYVNDQIYVAWTSQDPDSGIWNIYMRVLGRDGAGQLGDQTNITPSIAGEPVSITVWEPAIAPLPEGGAVVAVSALTTRGARVVLQKVDALGLPVGEAFYVWDTETTLDQQNPSLSIDDDGRIYVAYSQSGANGIAVAYHTSFAPGSIKPAPEVPEVAHPTQQPNPLAVLSKSSGGPSDVPWLAFHVTADTRHDIYVKDATQTGLASHYQDFGVANRSNHRPAVDASPTGGALVWYTANASINRNQVNVQRFNLDSNGSFMTQGRVALPMEQEAIPYGSTGPDIAHLFDHVYALTWSEGDTNRTTRQKVRLVDLR